MARYRPIDVRLWTDRRFLSLSDQAKLLWIFLLTTPSTLPIPGVIIGGEATLSEQLGWPVELFRELFHEVVRAGLKVRSEGRVVWLSNALKYQPPKNPNAIKGWAKVWDDIPEGELKHLIWQALKIACKSWNILFSKLFPQQFGEQFAQLLLEQLGTGSGSGTGTGTGTETGSGSGTGSRSGPAQIPLPPWQPTLVPDSDREKLKRALVSCIGPAHVMAFARVKQALGSTAMGPSMVDKFEQLRELLDEVPSLEGMQEKCEYALAIQEAEAMHKRTLQYFGSSMWKRATFEKALAFELGDVNGTRVQRAPAQRTAAIGRVEPGKPEDYPDGEIKL